MPVCEDLYTKTKPVNWETKIQSKIWIKLDKLNKLLEFCKWHSLMIIDNFSNIALVMEQQGHLNSMKVYAVKTYT